MSSHSGTIGRKRGNSSGGSGSSEYYFGSGGEKMRRQRSAEWHSRHGYSSSEDEYQNTGKGTAFDTQLLAQLLLQSQQLANMDRYGSDAENGEIASSLLQDFPSSKNRDFNATQAYQQQQHENTGLCSPLKQQQQTVSTANSKYQNNPLASAQKLGAMSSTSSAKRSTNPFLNSKYDSQSNSDSLSERLSFSGSTAMSDRLQATADYNAASTTTQSSTYQMPGNATGAANGLNSGPQALVTSSTGTTRAHRSKNGRTLSSRASGMTSSSSGTSSNGNAANSATATANAAAVAAAMANRNEREKLKLQQIQMELREFAQSASENSAIAGNISVFGHSSGGSGIGVGIVNVASDLDEFGGFGDSESEPPPEPAPPEIPPRAQSLLMSLRKHSDYKLKFDDKGDQKHEEFIPTSQLQQHQQKDYLIADNSRPSETQSKSIASSDSPSKQG